MNLTSNFKRSPGDSRKTQSFTQICFTKGWTEPVVKIKGSSTLQPGFSMARSQALFTKAQAFRSKLCFVPCWDLCGVRITGHLKSWGFFSTNVYASTMIKCFVLRRKKRNLCGIFTFRAQNMMHSYIINYIIILDHTSKTIATHFPNRPSANEKKISGSQQLSSHLLLLRCTFRSTPWPPNQQLSALSAATVDAAEDLNKCTVGNGARMLKSAGSGGPSA